jgi:hypothetical protein
MRSCYRFFSRRRAFPCHTFIHYLSMEPCGPRLLNLLAESRDLIHRRLFSQPDDGHTGSDTAAQRPITQQIPGTILGSLPDHSSNHTFIHYPRCLSPSAVNGRETTALKPALSSNPGFCSSGGFKPVASVVCKCVSYCSGGKKPL